MALAIDDAAASGMPIVDSVETAARQVGTTLDKESRTGPATDKAAHPSAQTRGVLVRHGYEPVIEDGSISLLNVIDRPRVRIVGRCLPLRLRHRRRHLLRRRLGRRRDPRFSGRKR